MSALSAVCIMEDNGKIENSYAARAFRMGAEFLTDDLIDELAQEAVDKTSILFQAIKLKAGKCPLSWVPVLWHLIARGDRPCFRGRFQP